MHVLNCSVTDKFCAMGIFKQGVHSKIGALRKTGKGHNSGNLRSVYKKIWIPSIWVIGITYMYSLYLTIVMIIIKCCIMFVPGISVEMFTTASTLFF